MHCLHVVYKKFLLACAYFGVNFSNHISHRGLHRSEMTMDDTSFIFLICDVLYIWGQIKFLLLPNVLVFCF